jgi:hypothetical protein
MYLIMKASHRVQNAAGSSRETDRVDERQLKV